MIMESHPLALMEEGRAFSDFCADIAEHGLREPIITYEGKVLDGRNIEKGIPPTFREWTGPGSPLDLVISLNLQRRHLTQSQRATNRP